MSILETKTSRGRGRRGRRDAFLHEHEAVQLGFLPSAGGLRGRGATGLSVKEVLGRRRMSGQRVCRAKAGTRPWTQEELYFGRQSKSTAHGGKKDFGKGFHLAPPGLELAL